MRLTHNAGVSEKSAFAARVCILNIQIVIMFAILSFSVEATAQNYVFERLWPRLEQPWYFNRPQGVAVDASGNVIVADSFSHRIQVFDSSGTLIRKWGSLGMGDGQFQYPYGTAVDASGNVFVADSGNNRIQVFNPSGTFVRKWGSGGTGDGQFIGARGVFVDASGNVLVADVGNNRIQVFTSSGTFLGKLGSQGSDNGQFNEPSGLLADLSGSLFVADSRNNRIQKFIKAGGVPGAATLVSPSGSIGTAKPTFTWNAVSLATWYQLYVNDAKASPKIQQWYTAAEAGCGSGTGACSVTPSVELAVGSAQWWVRTWNDAGFGPWSDGMDFSVNAVGPPPKASLVSPSGTITTSTPTYTWNAISSSSWYLLYVNDSKTQAIINKWYKAADAKCDSGSGTCSVTPDTVLAAGACQWWIQTWNDSGSGPWSDGMVFSVQGGGPPGKATLISPSGTIAATTPTYMWNAVADSTWYLLWVNDSATSGKINKWYTAEQAGCASGGGICSVTPTTAAAAGTCTWWIQTWNSYGTGPWSDPMTFLVAGGGPPSKVTLVSPKGTISTATPTYTWNAAMTAIGYMLYVNDSKTQGKINMSLKASDAGCSSGTGTCSNTPATAVANGICEWWVQAYNDYGAGPWSAGMAFSVAAQGPIVPGAWHGSITGMSLDFKVNASADGITEIKYTFSGLKCEGVTITSGSVTSYPGVPWPISNRQFEITRQSNPKIDLTGTFGDDGTTVSGTWKWLTCSGAWTGSPSAQNAIR